MTHPPAQPTDQDPWITPHEIAAELRVSKMTAYRLINSGQIPGVRVGRSLRVRQSELDNYLDHARTEAWGVA